MAGIIYLQQIVRTYFYLVFAQGQVITKVSPELCSDLSTWSQISSLAKVKARFPELCTGLQGYNLQEPRAQSG